jgi:Zn finger protein HypA/HybF involved in hydrogenase expression
MAYPILKDGTGVWFCKIHMTMQKVTEACKKCDEELRRTS